MSFYRKYELERLVQKAEPKTFRAREVAGGRPVYLHLLAGMDAASRTALLLRARGLVAAGNVAILDVDDNEFAPYVVTCVLEDFEGLPAWLDRLPQTAAPTRKPLDAGPTETMARPFVPPPRSAAPPPVATAPPAGEFTALFASAETLRPRPTGSSQQPVAQPPGSQQAPAPPPPAAPPRAPEPAPPVFRAPAPPVAPPAQAMPLAAAPAPGAEAGEFTRMFSGSPPGRPASPIPPPRPPPAAAAAPAGSEFSKLFGPGALGQPAPPAGGEEPGEFSKLFGAPPGMPADNPAGFAPQAAAKQRVPDAPLPWEPQAAPPPQPAAAAPPPPTAPTAPPRPLVETPDTQKMQAYAPPIPPPKLPAPPPAPAAPPPALDQSASMWNSPPPASPGQNRSEHSGSGEFARFFASPLASSSLPIEDIEQGRMPEAKASGDRPFDGPGEFTRWFGKSAPGDNAPPPGPPAQYPTYAGRATGLFEMPQMPAPPPGSGPAAPKGPSEYTGIMAAPRIDEPAAYVPGAKQGRGPIIAIIIVIVVVVILLGVVVFLSMRH